MISKVRHCQIKLIVLTKGLVSFKGAKSATLFNYHNFSFLIFITLFIDFTSSLQLPLFSFPPTDLASPPILHVSFSPQKRGSLPWILISLGISSYNRTKLIFSQVARQGSSMRGKGSKDRQQLGSPCYCCQGLCMKTKMHNCYTCAGGLGPSYACSLLGSSVS